MDTSPPPVLPGIGTGGSSPSILALAPSPFCLICNNRCKLLKSVKAADQNSSNMTRMLGYPVALLGLDLDLDRGAGLQSQLKEFVLCYSCEKGLQQINLIMDKLENLHRKVLEFQTKVQNQINSCLSKTPEDVESFDSNQLLEGIRKTILNEINSRERFGVRESMDFDQTQLTPECLESRTGPGTSTVAAQLPQCVVRVGRLKRKASTQLEPPVLADIEIKQEPDLVPEIDLMDMELEFGEQHLQDEHHIDDEEDLADSIQGQTDPDDNNLESASSSDPEFIPPKKAAAKRKNRSAARKVKLKLPNKKGKTKMERTLHQNLDMDGGETSTGQRQGQPKTRRFACQYDDCGFKAFQRAQLPKHVLCDHFQSPSAIFLCWRCGAHFLGQEKLLQDHEESHLCQEKMYSCKHCSVSFFDLRRLRYHYETKHPGKTLPTKKDFPDILSSIKSRNTVKTCPHCFEEFKNTNLLRNHIASHTKPRKCDVDGCTARFAQLHALRAHFIRFHPQLNIPGYKCKYCPFQTNRSQVLGLHIAAKHEANYAAVCTFEGCNFRTPEASRLKQHIERKHEGKKNFLCTECGKGFYHQNDLKLHMRCHTGEMPHECRVCGKKFRVKRHMTRHEQIHRTDLRFICELCGVRFPSQNNLAGHRHSWHKGGTERIGIQPTRKGKYNSDLPEQQPEQRSTPVASVPMQMPVVSSPSSSRITGSLRR